MREGRCRIEKKKADWFLAILEKMKNKLSSNEDEPPPGFGTDEISQQMKRNSEPFETWWDRNYTKREFAHRALIRKLCKAAYERRDV